jgi:hypothetical protein
VQNPHKTRYLEGFANAFSEAFAVSRCQVSGSVLRCHWKYSLFVQNDLFLRAGNRQSALLAASVRRSGRAKWRQFTTINARF